MRGLAFLLTILSLQALAYPEIINTNKTYKVIAEDKSSLLSALNKASPILEGGEIFHGYTDTYVNWNYRWDKRENYCKLHSVSTKVKITYTLPDLVNRTNSTDLQNVWNQYYPALVEHEKGHGQIAIDAAIEIEKVLINLPAYPDCDALSTKANATANEILERYRSKHKTYDRETGHGKTQGADIKLYL